MGQYYGGRLPTSKVSTIHDSEVEGNSPKTIDYGLFYMHKMDK